MDDGGVECLYMVYFGSCKILSETPSRANKYFWEQRSGKSCFPKTEMCLTIGQAYIVLWSRMNIKQKSCEISVEQVGAESGQTELSLN